MTHFIPIIKHHKKSSKEFSSPPPEINAKLLDYGCGNGAFLLKMKALGWEVTGLDASANAIAVANAAGIKALRGDFDHPEVASLNDSTITPGAEIGQLPSARTVGFQVNLKF